MHHVTAKPCTWGRRESHAVPKAAIQAAVSHAQLAWLQSGAAVAASAKVLLYN
jgi:hypothetical protein